uniref:Uncharacterized protein LOC8275559 isoform X1 n=1 Tax=Rhizophora mucronata TaxID=61149 RepID=A0A2P2L9V8_RHIMU
MIKYFFSMSVNICRSHTSPLIIPFIVKNGNPFTTPLFHATIFNSNQNGFNHLIDIHRAHKIHNRLQYQASYKLSSNSSNQRALSFTRSQYQSNDSTNYALKKLVLTLRRYQCRMKLLRNH